MAARDKAKLVAKLLSRRFLTEGKYSLAAGRTGQPGSGMKLAGTQKAIWEETAGFDDVAVQAVGHEVGVDEPKVVIYATKGSDRAFKKLPQELNGVEVRVRKIGPVTIKPELASGTSGQGQMFLRKGRIACGSSCAPASEHLAGTIGALVRKAGQLFALSNNHIFGACNHTPVGMPILSPATEDASAELPGPREIARHAEIEPLRSGDPALVCPCSEDLAIARVTDAAILSSWQGGDTGYDTPTKTIAPVTGMKVRKFGRTTGVTVGVLDSFVSDPTPIPCQTKTFKGTVWFCDMWYVMGDGGAFALSGDSGSLVVTEDGQHAVGILFACNRTGEFGQIIPIDHVLKHFGGVTLVAGHGV
jgi:hypothetical protein